MYVDENSIDYRNLIAGLDAKILIEDNRVVKAINFDNAATTPAFKYVLQQIVDFSEYYSSIHRGAGFKSKLSSEIYELSREVICNFVHCDKNKNSVIYVKNATEAINKLSYILHSIDKNAVILTTRMEHHSDDLPWRDKFNVDYIEVDNLGKLKINHLREKLKEHDGKVKLVCVTGASNVTGYKNPIHKIAKIAHSFGAKILVDGAQLVPHYPIYMEVENKEECIDYLAFSAHKMYAPFGIGVLIGPKSTFNAVEPEYKGGGTIKIVNDDDVTWADTPDRNEAGTPNVMGVVALMASIQKLTELNMINIDKHEMNIYNYALDRILELPDIEVYCDTSYKCSKVAILPFNIEGMYHETCAELLSNMSGIAVRSGCFCAHPYVQRLLRIPKLDIDKYKNNPEEKRPGLVRLSFSLYNTYEEVDVLIKTLSKIIKNKDRYIDK